MKEETRRQKEAERREEEKWRKFIWKIIEEMMPAIKDMKMCQIENFLRQIEREIRAVFEAHSFREALTLRNKKK